MSPWLAEAKRRNPSEAGMYADCGRCMRETPRETRRALACAYEAPLVGARGYAVGFVLVALAPLAAVPVTPAAAETALRRAAPSAVGSVIGTAERS